MVRLCKYVTDYFFLSPELDEMIRNDEDVPSDPLCVPDDPLDSITLYPMEDVCRLLRSMDEIEMQEKKRKEESNMQLRSMDEIEMQEKKREEEESNMQLIDLTLAPESKESDMQLVNLTPFQDSKELKRGRGRPRKSGKTRPCIPYPTGVRKRGRPRKNSLHSSPDRSMEVDFVGLDSEDMTVISSRGIPRRKRGYKPRRREYMGGGHVWSVDTSVLTTVGNPIQAQSSSSNRYTTETETSSSSDSDGPTRRCHHCMREDTPQWRKGPDGAGTLCNACGLRYKQGKLAI